MTNSVAVFSHFAPPVGERCALRKQITKSYQASEADVVARLLPLARQAPSIGGLIAETGRQLITNMRDQGQPAGIAALVQEYSLSSDEGVALMCLAEALLRIPDNATRDALIRDKLSGGAWKKHLGSDRSLFVNASTWGLVVSGGIVKTPQDSGLAASLNIVVGRLGEPVIRASIKLAMELMGEEFVLSETIETALKRARKAEAKGYSYSYDMLGEAAVTKEDAQRFFEDYSTAIDAIGKAGGHSGPIKGPGISVKLSALHPRYERAQQSRVVEELLPRLRQLASQARSYDIGFNIDAEEADRLELSLDLLEALALDPDLAGWHGLGFVVQAYSKRCSYVIDWIIDLAKRSNRRLMVRLVKGAYWDSEIKHAQVEGLQDFPVFTRKVHTDISFIACARKLLAAKANIFSQFATHNAQSIATIYHMAGPDFAEGDYEFQCLHGMGEALYSQVVGADKLARPCRIYAPVGSHETLLAYLVRRLLENGANSSFINQVWDKDLDWEALLADPAQTSRQSEPLGAPHADIAAPDALYPDRANSRGLNLSNEDALEGLAAACRSSANREWRAAPTLDASADQAWLNVCNPSDHRDIVGQVRNAQPSDVDEAMHRAKEGAARWAQVPVAERCDILNRAANDLEGQTEELIGLLIREAGKTAANAINEVREAVDFLRYYSVQARPMSPDSVRPLGPVVCISPWNFPLAIFLGQVSAALVVGNTVLAKPAEETPLIAAIAVDILHSAGVPANALQLLPGGGQIGAALVQHEATCAVMFTGSTEVAKGIQNVLAGRTLNDGSPIPLIAETGGQNAMIVDSSALPEQVIKDVLASAFDSAGQRCSALRILCLQDDIADDLIAMLESAIGELSIGHPDRLSVDVGPVISGKAQDIIAVHIDAMRASRKRVVQAKLPTDMAHGTFVPPTIIEIDGLGDLGREVFGPVLHVLRFKESEICELVQTINATGYGLTFGIHSRIDETISKVRGLIGAGNVYVNRNTVGAIVGVQPFGGNGLSGTGPKAGGPLYLDRLTMAPCEDSSSAIYPASSPKFWVVAEYVEKVGSDTQKRRCAQYGKTLPVCFEEQTLPGPVGEENVYLHKPCGNVLCQAHSAQGLLDQLIAVFATSNRPLMTNTSATRALAEDLPSELAEEIEWASRDRVYGLASAVLIERQHPEVADILRAVANETGPIICSQLDSPNGAYRMELLIKEVSTSIDTTAAGGNASLLALT